MSQKKKSGIAGALTRKFGPLPAWAWAVIAFVGIYYYRKKLSSSSSSTTGIPTDTTAAPTPQAPQVLQPGESLYDPNTGALTTAPGSSDSSSTVPPDYNALAAAVAAAVVAAEPQPQPIGGGPALVPSNPTPSTPAPTVTAPIRPNYAPSNAIWKGPNKPGPGWRGIGGGWWAPPIPSTKRTAKPKTALVKTGARTAKPPAINAKSRPRSTAALKSIVNRTAKSVVRKPAPKTTTRGGARPNAVVPRTSSRGTSTKPLVTRPVVRQRPVAVATPRVTTPPRPATAGRKPPTRTAVRTVRPAPPKPTTRRR